MMIFCTDLRRGAVQGILPSMTQKLLNKTKFAQLAGVNPSTITRLCKTLLKAATFGKQVDAAHPDAVKYLQDKDRDQTPPAAIGLDVRYDEIASACRVAGRFSIRYVRKTFSLGEVRAKRIVETMKATGIDKAAPPPPPPPKPEPVATKPRGQLVVKEAKKRQPPPPPPEEGVIEIPEDIQTFADMTLRDLIEKFGTDVRFVDWLSATQKIEMINEKRLKNATTEGELVSRKVVRTGIIEPIDACHIKLLTDGAKTIARRATAMHAAERPLDDIEKFVAEQITSFIRPVKSKVARALKRM